MIDIKDKLTSLLPTFVSQDHPKLVDFLSAYYEWLEQSDNPVGYIRSLKTNMDIDQSVDDFVSRFKNEIIPFIPEDTAVDKSKFIKFINDITSTRGSEYSYKLLFKMLYNEDIEIYYPKDDIFRFSDGKWIKNEIVLYVTNIGNDITQYENTVVTQTRILGGGKVEYALGLITNTRQFISGNYNIISLSLTDVEGEFKYGWPVVVNNQYVEFIYPTVKDVSIDVAGTGYALNEAINWSAGSYFEINGTINVNLKTDLEITTSFNKTDLYVEVDSVDIVQDFEFDGRKITLSNYAQGQDVLVRIPSLPGTATIGTIGGSGEITGITRLIDPIGYNITHSISINTVGGTGATLSSVLSDYVNVAGRFKTTDGFLSSNKYLQDGTYYQDYSYVIKASNDISSYSEVVKKILHPAGMKMFGEIGIFDILILALSFEDFSKAIFPIEETSINSLGPTVGSIQLFKWNYEITTYPVAFFDPYTEDEITTTPGNSVNFEAPPTIEFLYEGIDVDLILAAAEDIYNITHFYMPNRVDEFELVNPVWPLP